jgi:ATPase subunit of ABC transporter with duplicated ATPase domains
MSPMTMTEDLFTQPHLADRHREQTDPILQLENINVSFDGFKALTNLSLNIGIGELRCVIGPNGAGENDADGCHYRQNQTAKRSGVLRSAHRSDQTRSGAHRAVRHWPQIPEADCLRSADRIRKSGDRAENQ